MIASHLNSRVLTCFGLIVLATAVAAGQGPLAPTGTPAPIMKSLDQVEARTPIGQPATFPINITTSGSYYLTQNLTVSTSNTNAIFINASFVTLDLNGFLITGPGNVGTTGNGIAVNGATAISDIVIENGSVTNFRGEGISIPVGTTAVPIGSVTGVHLRNLQVFSCNLGQGVDSGLAGIRTGSVGVIENCIARNNNNGIIVGNGMLVQNCVSDNNARNGMVIGANNVIRHNMFKNNGQVGNGRQDAGLFLPASVTAFPVAAAQNRIEGNHFLNNAEFGIQITADENLVILNTAVDNGAGAQGDNYQIGPNNRYGSLLNVSGTGQFTSSESFANFYY